MSWPKEGSPGVHVINESSSHSAAAAQTAPASSIARRASQELAASGNRRERAIDEVELSMVMS